MVRTARKLALLMAALLAAVLGIVPSAEAQQYPEPVLIAIYIGNGVIRVHGEGFEPHSPYVIVLFNLDPDDNGQASAAGEDEAQTAAAKEVGTFRGRNDADGQFTRDIPLTDCDSRYRVRASSGGLSDEVTIRVDDPGCGSGAATSTTVPGGGSTTSTSAPGQGSTSVPSQSTTTTTTSTTSTTIGTSGGDSGGKSSGPLAFTGADSLTLLRVAILTIAFGTLAVYSARKRRARADRVS